MERWGTSSDLSSFDFAPRLSDDRFLIRPLLPEDREALQAVAADPEIRAGQPSQDRWRPEVFGPYFEFLTSSGGAVAICEAAGGAVIGCSRYYVAPDTPDAISIGFTFLRTAYWGGPANRAVKGLMLAHAFERVEDVWFHIAPTNIRSQKATAKLGATFEYDATLDLSGVAAPWKCYRLRRDAWRTANAA